MDGIIFRTNPLEIIEPIIQTISVNMIYRTVTIRILKKIYGNKLMNQKRFPFSFF